MAKIAHLSDKYKGSLEGNLRDTRPMSKKLVDSIKTPNAAVMIVGFCALVALAAPTTSDFMLIVGGLYFLWFRSLKQTLPLRLPIQAKEADPNDGNKPARGLLYLGNDDSHEDQEIWINNDDARTHFLLLGTTGSGKTEALLSISTNALSWGSGFLYTDGKGDSSLWGKIFSLTRKFGREDDLLVLNFMTGNVEGGGSSNTMNPFSTGTAAGLTEMIVGLMDDPGKEGDMWKGRAIGLISTLMIALVDLRDRGKLLLDVHTIQDHLVLDKLVDLYLDRNGNLELSEKAKRALRNYFDSLPGFDWNEARAGRPQSGTTNDQHGYLTMQFTRVMGSLADTYGYIFGTELGDVDLYDVVVNRRILVVLLPALEKSEDELANLGKIVVASLKGMMATTLGSAIEGQWKDIIDTKPTNSPTPFLAILDEVGYYTVPGMAVMAAQARSLGFSMIYAAQDLAAMKKRSEKEAESIIANTNMKIFMKLEDEGSKELFKKSVGGAVVTETSGFSMDQNQMFLNYYDMRNASVRERSLEDFYSLKKLKPGQCYMAGFGKSMPTQLFYANPPMARELRYNKMIPVRHPDLGALGSGAVDTIIERLSDANFTAASIEPVKPTEGELAVVAKTLVAARNVTPLRRSCAALAALARNTQASRQSAAAAYRDPMRDDTPVDEFTLDDFEDGMYDSGGGNTGQPVDEDLFARLWGSVSNDVVAGIQALQEAAVGDVGDTEGAVQEVARAASAAVAYPDGPPPATAMEERILEAIMGFRRALAGAATGTSASASAPAAAHAEDDWDVEPAQTTADSSSGAEEDDDWLVES